MNDTPSPYSDVRVQSPKSVEALLIEGKRKLSYQSMESPPMVVEILVKTELVVDMCERIIRLEKRLEELDD